MKKGTGEEELKIGGRWRTAEDGRRKGGKIGEGEEEVREFESGPHFKASCVSKAQGEVII